MTAGSVGSWFGSLDGAAKTVMAALFLIGFGAGAVPLLGIPARLEALELKDKDQDARADRLEARGRFNTCVILAQLQRRDPDPCTYFLPNPAEYLPPNIRLTQ